MKYFRVAPGKIVRADSDELTYHWHDNLAIGTVVDISHGRSTSSGVVLGQVKLRPKFKTKEIVKVRQQRLPEPLVTTLVWMSKYYAVPLPLVVSNALPSGIDKKRRVKNLADPIVARPMSAFKLTPKQKQAAKQTIKAKSTVLLHGDTGSGKTLIYREAIKDAVLSGRSAMVLVPEIGLTPQAAGDYEDLADDVWVTHSGLSQSQRHQLWQKIAESTKPAIVIGPRSALLMPLKNIGLIVLDEAHENSYKQDVSPRYQSQTVAAYLAAKHSAKLVLGTATPRLTDYYLAKSLGTPIITLPKYSQTPAKIEVVDRADKDQFLRSRYLSNTLIKQIDSALSRGEQSMLYLNRRGTATVGLCISCGWTAICQRCDSQLTLHQDLSQLRCHVCGWHGRIPSACPDCSQPDLAYKGAGTKRIEEEVKKLWPAARTARFDTDSLKGERLVDLYRDLHDGVINIAIGTQMVARGLDLPKLKVVGVVSADSELYLPDFSAGERTYQLLHQVIGRAGRISGGQVVVQAWQTKHPAIKLAILGDWQKFYAHESAVRKAHNYPPYAYLMAMVCSFASRAKSQRKAQEAMQTLADKFGLNAIGPAPAFYEKRGPSYRWQVIAKSKRRGKLLNAARHFRQVGWQIDLDPINLLY